MRRSVVSVLIVATCILGAAPANAQNGSAGSTEEAVRATEFARREALLRADTVALSRMTASEFYEVNRFGLVRARATNMQEIASGALRLKTVAFDSITIHAYGDFAVLTAIADNTGEFRGNAFSGRIRYTRVFVHREGRWQAIVMQHTPIQ